MLKLSKVDTIWRSNDFVGVEEQIAKLERPKKRIAELMVKSVKESNVNDGNRRFLPVFFRSPLKVHGDSKVDSIEFGVTRLENNKAILTGDSEIIPADFVCRSIGYKSICVDEAINFDTKHGKVKNQDGRILKKDCDEVDPGLYVAGWLATGPSGVILTTMNNAFVVAQKIIHDIQSGAVKCDSSKAGINPKNHRIVSWRDWEQINRKEEKNGTKVKKPREKLLTVDDMIKVLN